MLDLVFAIGNYHLVSFALNAFGVERDDGVDDTAVPFPPRRDRLSRRGRSGHGRRSRAPALRSTGQGARPAQARRRERGDVRRGRAAAQQVRDPARDPRRLPLVPVDVAAGRRSRAARR